MASCDPGSLLSGAIEDVFEERQVLDESGNFQHYNGNFNSHGKFTDATGLKYNYKLHDHSIIHDDLPHTFQRKARVTSQGDGDNWEFVFTVHVNEQDKVTKMESNEECKG